ncbi:MAG: hypothetical protein Kow0089_10930 [Desulfobulbaceae bacterium]
MAKIGRNDPCPCGSGLKYKRCCLRREGVAAPVSPAGQLRISLLAEIEKIQNAARQREEVVRELGVFVLWANTEGEAWLLEISESDAVQVAAGGTPLDVPIEENPETIEINWSHTFAIRDRRLFVTTYADKEELCLDTAPVKRINAAIRRIRKKFPEEVLNRVHVDEPAGENVLSS